MPASRSPAFGLTAAAELRFPSFELDRSFGPIPMASPPGAFSLVAEEERSVVTRGTIRVIDIPKLENDPRVMKVWRDAPIAPFGGSTKPSGNPYSALVGGPLQLSLATTPCPIGICDCDPNTPKGTVQDVAEYLGVTSVWRAGFRGQGIVVGVIDGGILADGRAKTGKVGHVLAGYPEGDWGTKAAWNEHGCMTATDVLGMAPEVGLLDIRISDSDDNPGVISNALAGFQWAIDRFRSDGTPQVLSNSWGIYRENWAPDYARDANHVFTRKVLEAIDAGMIVLFAAGNCGDTCPNGQCGTDTGPGKDIWGANGHPRVMTVGAVNTLEQLAGYSSRGPAALDPQKPDFCSITHFAGYFPSVNPTRPADTGTSAATPIAAGVCVLLKQVKPDANQDVVKQCLMSTAKKIGGAGFDQSSGAGIIQAKEAFDRLAAQP